MGRIATARMPGGLKLVAPDMFPEDSYNEPMVANMVDIAARDTAEVIAPLPAFNCSSSTAVSDRARTFADRRGKIANAYVEWSRLQIQMYTAADRYVTYGFVPAIARPDLVNNRPVIEFLDPRGCYYTRDAMGWIKRFFQVKRYTSDDAIAKFPELAGVLANELGYNKGTVEMVRFHDAQWDGVFCMTGGSAQMVRLAPNVVGKVMVHVHSRPGLEDEGVGQFDDVLAVQVAKARFALLTLEAATKGVQAPMAMPSDVQELSFGPDSILRSQFPEKIRRVGLDLSPSVFMQQRDLDMELRQGSRYPDVRTGNTDASIVTGRGVKALMTGFDTQIKTAQAVFAEGLQNLVSRCFEMDEKLWPNRTREVRGNANGTPFSITYTPAKDIKGDHTVDVQYGLMAGLDPNQALVFGLQALGAQLVSKDFIRRQLPFPLDASEEDSKVDIEQMREALKQAAAGYAQAIPALAQQGQDPSQILMRMAQVITDRTKGVSIEKAISDAFAPPKEEPVPAPQGDQMPAAGGGGLGGLGVDGLMPDVAPGQAGMAPGGRPDLMTLLAGVGASGKPNMGASVQRRVAV